MSETPIIPTGWVSLLNSKKYHFVEKRQTLCKKFLYLGNDYQGQWTGKSTPDDCSGCVKALQKRDSKNQPTKLSLGDKSES